jgi:hypothetical protein
VDRPGEFGAAAGGVDILDAQQETAAGQAGQALGLDGREGVAQMQQARGRGGETGDQTCGS